MSIYWGKQSDKPQLYYTKAKDASPTIEPQKICIHNVGYYGDDTVDSYKYAIESLKGNNLVEKQEKELIVPISTSREADLIREVIEQCADQKAREVTTLLDEVYEQLKEELKMNECKFKVGDIVIRKKEGCSSLPNDSICVVTRIADDGFMAAKIIDSENKKIIGEVLGGLSMSYFEPVNNMGIKLLDRYIINDGATILFWNDGTKTIVKRTKGDKFDKRIAFLTAYFQKHSGLSRTKANKFLADLKVEEPKEKVKKKSNKTTKTKVTKITIEKNPVEVTTMEELIDKVEPKKAKGLGKLLGKKKEK